jgi:hypothetical protein
VGCAMKDLRSLPFGHKKLFADLVSGYDLFHYSKGKTLNTERNIRTFVTTGKSLLVACQLAGNWKRPAPALCSPEISAMNN